MTLELVAPAKVNLTLEVTGRRPDGYHDLVSVMQTIDLCDRVRLSDAPTLELVLDGEELRGVPREGPRNLAFAAAQALASAAGDASLGARIELDKRVPAGAGLGGGSTDAAAVLRGLNRLWGLDYAQEKLCDVGASLGSDVPFFISCGTCLVTGRGEQVRPLADWASTQMCLFLPSVQVEDKTRRMYGRIGPEDFSDGRKGRVLAASMERGLPLAMSDLVNVFDRYAGEVAPSVESGMALCRREGVAVMLCGSGPAFFAPVSRDSLPPFLARELLRDWGIRTLGCRSLQRAEGLAVAEV